MSNLLFMSDDDLPVYIGDSIFISDKYGGSYQKSIANQAIADRRACKPQGGNPAPTVVHWKYWKMEESAIQYQLKIEKANADN